MADRDVQIRAGRGIHPDPEIGGVGAVLKNIFRPLGSQFGPNVRGWGEGGLPGPLSWIRHCTGTYYWYCCTVRHHCIKGLGH